jgi:hypothetical protein
MRSRLPGQLLAAAALTCGLGGVASAGVITSIATSVFPGASTGSIGPVGITPSPNNDNAAAASPNTLPYSVFFNAGGLGNLDIEFVVANSGGTTEYRVTNSLLGVVNNTGQAWTDFHFQLGFGVGQSFVPSSALDALDFDTPDRDPTPSSTVFTNLNHQTDSLDWTGGSVPSVGVVRFELAIDVPDNLQSINPNSVSRFTLRQTPTVQVAAVSEPITAILLLAALLAMARAIRRPGGSAHQHRATDRG